MLKKHTFIVFTQYLENYGAHDSDGFYWKPKGGDTWIVSNCSREWDAQAAVQLAISQHGASLGYLELVTKVTTLAEWDPSHEDMQEYSKEFRHINVETHFECWAELTCKTHNERLVCVHCEAEAEALRAKAAAEQSAE